MPASSGLRETSVLIGTVLDKLLRIDINVIKIHISLCQRLCDVGKDYSVDPRLLVIFLCRNFISEDTHILRSIKEDSQNAKFIVGICVFKFGDLNISHDTVKIFSSLIEGQRPVHGQHQLIILRKILNRLIIKKISRSMSDYLGNILLNIFRKGLITRQILARIRFLGVINTGHVVQKRRDSLFQIRDLRSLLQKNPLFTREALRFNSPDQLEGYDNEEHRQHGYYVDPVIPQDLCNARLLTCIHIRSQSSIHLMRLNRECDTVHYGIQLEVIISYCK